MLDLLKTRRSVRKYKDKKVEKEKIDTIVKAMLMAPTSNNRKGWEFLVVEDEDKLKKLSQSREKGSQFLDGAPLAIVIATEEDPYDVWIEDTSIAATIAQLTIHSLGLSSCWIQVRNRNRDENTSTGDCIKKLLDIPAKAEIECMIAIGYPDEEKAPHDEETLRYDKVRYI